MKITAVETYWTRIPFDMGGKPASAGGLGWQSMNTVWLRIVTDQGLEGWGEGFGHASAPVTKTVMDTQLAPAVLGQDPRDIAGLRHPLAKAFHGFGRNGSHVFALSAFDIALWDLAGKAAGMPLWRLFGATPVSQLTAYASLLRYGEATMVAAACERAVARGYRDIKLHETTAPAVFAARKAIGSDIPLMVDMNCPLNGEEAIAFAHSCRDAAPMFLEEPVWPPEDFVTLAEVRSKGGLNVAAGENACTAQQFRQMMTAGAVSHAQPSVIKVGGITEYLKVVDLADKFGIRLAPHSPYFGPGLLATLQLLALRDDSSFVEMFYMKRAGCLWRGGVDVNANGDVLVPQGPGIGYEPDRDVMEKFRVS